ncbi:MAG: thiamine phosphate synthase [Nitrospirae bacterium]|nr:thiamine phosphate synthase [Nitrospirota bacterium]
MKTLFNNNRALYLITDRTISRLPLKEIVRQALSAGIKTIQIREKTMSKKELYMEIVCLKPLFAKHRALLIVNDYVDIALAVNAGGVHLGQEDMPVNEARKILGKNKIIGVSTHSLKQAVEAERAGADYIGFGPMFHTATKNAGRPKGINALREIRSYIRIPLIAIGGITVDNVSGVFNAGADAVAAASGILSGDIKTNAEEFFRRMNIDGL